MCGVTSGSRIVIFGRRGFIGTALTRCLVENNHSIIGVTRSGHSGVSRIDHVTDVRWDAKTIGDWVHVLDGADAVINLVGENIASGPWTPHRKRVIRDSRLQAVTLIIDAIRQCSVPPRVFCQASAIGIYGFNQQQDLTEQTVAGTGFLASLARDVESTASQAESVCRVQCIRTGIVLGRGGGFLPKVILPFKFHVGGHFGDGQQAISWIHIDDEVQAIAHLVHHPTLSGPFNLVAPAPVSLRELTDRIAHQLHRRSWCHIPAFLLKCLPGNMGNELFLNGPHVVPSRLLENGFKFSYPTLDRALDALLP